MDGNTLIISGMLGIVFYFWGYLKGRVDGIKYTKKRYVACVDERRGQVTYVQSKSREN